MTRDQHTRAVKARDGVGQRHVPAVRDTRSYASEKGLLSPTRANKRAPKICKKGNADLAQET